MMIVVSSDQEALEVKFKIDCHHLLLACVIELPSNLVINCVLCCIDDYHRILTHREWPSLYLYTPSRSSYNGTPQPLLGLLNLFKYFWPNFSITV